jgi:hypothetical protein
MTVKVKQLSELLAGQSTAAAATASSTTTAGSRSVEEDVRKIFGGLVMAPGEGEKEEDEETFDAMVRRHRSSWTTTAVSPTRDGNFLLG